MAIKRPKPSPSTIAVDSENLAMLLDLLPADKLEALAAAYPEQYGDLAMARSQWFIDEGLEFQTAQAEEVLRHPFWVEVDYEPSRERIQEQIAFERDSWHGLERLGIDDVRRELLVPDSQTANVNQFYRDLFGMDIDLKFSGVQGGDEDDEEERGGVVVNHRDRKHPYQDYSRYENFIKAVRREPSFIYMGDFWLPKNGYIRTLKTCMTTINGFCVDIDRVDEEDGSHFDGETMVALLMDYLESHEALCPNYLMLSGTGIQLWYVFGRSIPLLSKDAPRRAKYDDLLRRLYEHFDQVLPKNCFKVDMRCAAINHAFRAPYSPTKLGYPTRLFVMGAQRGIKRHAVSPLTLSQEVGGALCPYDIEEWDQESYERETGRRSGKGAPATEKQLAWIGKLHGMGCVPDDVFDRAGSFTIEDADKAIKAGETTFSRRAQRSDSLGVIKTNRGHTVQRHERHRGLYDYTLRRIPKDTPTGNRYLALFALAGLAYDCCIPKSTLQRDMESLLDTPWAQKLGHDRKPLNRADVKAAMTGYNPIGCLRPRYQVEECLGWSYGPSQKRNGRTRKEHLWGDWVNDEGTPVVNTARENRRLASGKSREASANKKREDAKKRLADFLRENPTATKADAVRALGMSRSTTAKYWADVCHELGIPDLRTGNHSKL